MAGTGSGEGEDERVSDKNEDQPLIGPEVLYPTPWRMAEQREYGHVVACATGHQAAAVSDGRLGELIVKLVNEAGAKGRAGQPDSVGELAAIAEIIGDCEVSEYFLPAGSVVDQVRGLRNEVERLRQEVQRLMKEPPW